jgi:hypothetical protein
VSDSKCCRFSDHWKLVVGEFRLLVHHHGHTQNTTTLKWQLYTVCHTQHAKVGTPHSSIMRQIWGATVNHINNLIIKEKHSHEQNTTGSRTLTHFRILLCPLHSMRATQQTTFSINAARRRLQDIRCMHRRNQYTARSHHTTIRADSPTPMPLSSVRCATSCSSRCFVLFSWCCNMLCCCKNFLQRLAVRLPAPRLLSPPTQIKEGADSCVPSLSNPSLVQFPVVSQSYRRTVHCTHLIN